jgi:hypothetical protein
VEAEHMLANHFSLHLVQLPGAPCGVTAAPEPEPW